MLAYEQFVEDTTKVVKRLNRSADEDENLLKEVAEEVADRLSLYLNLEPTPSGELEFDTRLTRIAARIVNNLFIQTTRNVDGGDVETSISSISDNGQSISYGDTVKNYLATAEDNAIFGACAELLKPYRRIYVYS